MSNQPTFSPRTPQFFKIILEETLQENKLQIPKKFIRKYGESLSDSVSVKLPCGSKWEMKLKKHDGKVWLERGWPEFVKHYSIVRGHLLIFKYEGNSQFCAFIFDTSTTEIDYPVVAVCFGGDLQVPNREANEDDSIQILDEFSPSCKTREKYFLPCSRPPKRMKTGPTGETRSNFSHCKSEGAHGKNKSTQKNESKGNLETSKSEMKEKNGLPCTSDKDESTTKRQRELDNMKPLTRIEKFLALNKASGFKSERPFFKLVIQPSYIRCNHVNFPQAFASKYLKKSSGVIHLTVRDGRRGTWSVKYNIKAYHAGIYASLMTGWLTFVRENNLEVGDVCVFVLLKGAPLLMEVVVFRPNGNLEPPLPADVSAPEGGKVQVKQEKSPTNDIESGGNIIDETGIPINQARRCKYTSIERQRGSLKRKSVEKVKILERAVFESENPFFKVVMQPSYAAGSKGQLGVPLDFAERYLKNECHVVLSVENGASWSAQYQLRSTKAGKFSPVVCKGWKVFAEDNDLEVGDVCAFELVNRTDISFKVSIFRVSDMHMTNNLKANEREMA